MKRSLLFIALLVFVLGTLGSGCGKKNPTGPSQPDPTPVPTVVTQVPTAVPTAVTPVVTPVETSTPVTFSYAVTIANNILLEIEEINIPHDFSKTSDHVTVSIGYKTILCSDDSTSAELLRGADQSLYHAKKQGRNKVAT